MVSRFFGVIGLVTLGFGILGAVIVNSFSNPIVFIHVVVGLFKPFARTERLKNSFI